MDPEQVSADPAPRRHPWLRLALLVLGVAALAVAAKVFDLGAALASLKGWIQSLGFWAPPVFVLVYALATVAALPVTVLSVLSAALFAPVPALLLVLAGATLGATGSFLIARYLARDAVSGWLARYERGRRLDALCERHGSLVVLVTRLVPLFPFNLLNYALGLTRVPLPAYVLWTFVGMIPFTTVVVTGSSALWTGLRDGEVPWGLLGALAGAVAVLAGAIHLARRKLGGGQDP